MSNTYDTKQGRTFEINPAEVTQLVHEAAFYRETLRQIACDDEPDTEYAMIDVALKAYNTKGNEAVEHIVNELWEQKRIADYFKRKFQMAVGNTNSENDLHNRIAKQRYLTGLVRGFIIGLVVWGTLMTLGAIVHVNFWGG